MQSKKAIMDPRVDAFASHGQRPSNTNGLKHVPTLSGVTVPGAAPPFYTHRAKFDLVRIFLGVHHCDCYNADAKKPRIAKLCLPGTSVESSQKRIPQFKAPLVGRYRFEVLGIGRRILQLPSAYDLLIQHCYKLREAPFVFADKSLLTREVVDCSTSAMNSAQQIQN